MEEIELNNDELRNTTCNLDGDPKIGWFCNKNGLLLKTYGWLVKNAIGIILLIHGLKSHTRLTFMRINIKIPNNDGDVVVDNNNYYIYKDSWIEKFNQNGYSVYALDLQGHGESQAWKNIRGSANKFDDLVDDVIDYMNHIQDEISNENQTDDESYDIAPTKKKRLPMYIIGHSMGGSIAIRILQLLRKEKEDDINSGDEHDYKKCNIMLDNFTNANEISNAMVEDMINDIRDMNTFNDNSVKYISDKRCITNSKNGDPGTFSVNISAKARDSPSVRPKVAKSISKKVRSSNNSNDSTSGSTVYCSSDTPKASTSGTKQVKQYNHLDKLNIRGCISLSGMLGLTIVGQPGSFIFKYIYIPVTKLMSYFAPYKKTIAEFPYKTSQFIDNVFKYDKFRTNDGITYKYLHEIIKTMGKLFDNAKNMPKDVPLLLVHSKDDGICNYKGSQSYFDKIDVPGKELYIVEGLNHSTTLESGNEDVLKKVMDWINSRNKDTNETKKEQKIKKKKVKEDSKKENGNAKKAKDKSK
ncbi:lysophospholipase, putative [Plasmodium vinckei lentum]|uniref:Lysophospholipase, putative n=1 Tax=Plasmodium vinckei lentum TaxID=138297 RepID=A0A6V7RV03_PLAVN|nr:lysophospholipase, putative [Plasmodium vinckei lentum]